MNVSKSLYKSIGDNLGKIRNNNNKSQEDVAKAIGMQRANYTDIENGKGERHLKDVHIIQLSKLYGVSADYILGLTQETSTDVKIKSIYEKYGLTEQSLKNLELLNALEQLSKSKSNDKYKKSAYSIIDTINILLSELPIPSGKAGLLNFINTYINLYIDNNYKIFILDNGEIQVSNIQEIKNKKKKKDKKQIVASVNAESQLDILLLKIQEKLAKMRKEKQEQNNTETKNNSLKKNKE